MYQIGSFSLTQFTQNNVDQLKVSNNRVMCQMSVKLPAVFDQNPPQTFDKIVKKQITTKTLSKLDLEPKCQGHSRNQKTMICENGSTKGLSKKIFLDFGDKKREHFDLEL